MRDQKYQSFRRKLYSQISFLALVSLIASNTTASADVNDADATTDTAASSTVTASDTNGILDDNGADHTITIDSNSGALTFGTLQTIDGITFLSQSGDITATINITSSGTNNLVTFAGDVQVKGTESLILNATNTDILLQGDAPFGTGSSTLNLGDGSSSVSATFDTALNADNTIEMVINAASAADTVTLSVTNTDGTSGNEIIFTQAIGGASSATEIDVIEIASGAKATFNGAVRAGTIEIRTSEAITFDDSITADIDLYNDYTLSLKDGFPLNGSIDNQTGSDNAGTLNVVDQTGGATTIVSGDIGSTNSLKAVTAESSSNTITFGGNINATTITLTGTDDTDETIFQGNVTGSVVIDTAGLLTFTANKYVDGPVTSNTDGAGILEFETQTADTTLVSGNVGTGGGNSLKELIVNTGAGVTSTFGGTVDANTITVAGSGTVRIQDTINTTTLSFSSDATVNIAANKAISGAVDAGGTFGNLVFDESTTNTTLVSGSVGATNALSSIDTTIASGVTSTFAGTVAADTISVNGSGTIAFSDDVTGDIEIGDGGKVSLSAGKKIIGNIDNSSGSDGSGTASFGAIGGNLTLVSGSIGASNSLGSVTVDTTGGIATFSGSVNAEDFTATGSGSIQFGNGGSLGSLSSTGNINTGNTLLTISGDTSFTGGSSLNVGSGGLEFNGSSAQTVSAPINNTNNLSISNTSSSGVTFESALGATTPLGMVTLNSNTKTTFNNTVQATSLSSNGNLVVENTITLSGTATFNGGTLTIGDSFTPGDTIFSVNDVSASGSPTVQIAGDIQTGTYTLFDSVTDASDEVANFAPSTSILRSTELQVNGSDIELVVTTRTADSLATEFSVTNNQANILIIANDAIATGNDALLSDLIASVNAGGSTAQNAIKSLAVQSESMDAAISVASGLQNQVFLFTSDRLSAVRNPETASRQVIADTSTDRPDAKKSAWIKAFGFLADQDRTSDGESYDAGTAGSTFGYDAAITDKSRLGASFTYAYTDVDGGGAGNVSTQLNSYQGNLYADYSTKEFFIEGSVGYAFNSIKSSRVIDFLGSDTTARADYDSNQYMAAVQFGVPLTAGDYQITPMAGVSYTYLTTDDYRETGAGGLNQQVKTDNLQLLTTSVGAQISTQIRAGSGYFIPHLRGGVRYELLGENATATSQFTGGGSTFTVEGQDPEQFGAQLGLGFAYDVGEWILGANYDAEFKNNYLSHSGSLKAKLRF
ncbi:autotransporter domain-containing protein [Sneathiella limimaris]|uniref:autotransporter domain-containing protein n=1 Tax=Sneathiella limimaris TaxID=1964213 RepID=UPI00146F7D00|nr:autotransporter domain-containing protein [Sneathiella limimaris]